eukprot:NODE_234_length_13549_cov_0.394349.p1 type:complete len:810 gc:universal NODE_234_length_13549_cov_0.394349:6772-9201(+)
MKFKGGLLQMSYPRYEQGSSFGAVADSLCNSVGFKKFIICSGGYGIKMYNSNSGNFTEKVFKQTVSCLDIHLNRLAIGFQNGDIVVIELDLKAFSVNESKVILQASNHSQGVRAISIFDDYVSSSSSNDIIVHSIQAQQVIGRLQGHTDSVTKMQFYKNANDVYLTSVSKDTLLKVWSLDILECLDTAVGHRAEIWDTRILRKHSSELEILILTGGNDGINLWCIDLTDIGRKEKSCILESSVSNNKTSCLNVCGSYLFAGSNLKCVIYEFTTKRKDSKHSFKQISECFCKSHVKSIDFLTLARDKIKYFASTANNALEVKQFIVESKSCDSLIVADKKGHKHEIRICTLSQDDVFIATASKSEICIWNIKDRSNPQFVRNIELLGTRSLIFVPGNQFIIVGDEKGKLYVIEVDNDNIEEISGHNSDVWRIDMLPKQSGIITCGDKRLNVYNFKIIHRETSTSVPLLLSHISTAELTTNVLCCACNNDFIAVSLLDNTIRLLYIDSLKPYLVLYGHNLPAISLCFMNEKLISGSADKSTRVWGLDYGDCRKILKIHHERISGVAELKHDGYLASSEGPVQTCISCDRKGNIYYWDTQSFQIVQRFKSHRGDITSIASANHGDWFISTGKDRLITFWNRTDDEVFLQEEFDKQMDDNVELELVMNACDGKADRSITAIKAGERLLNAIELCAPGYNESIFKSLRKTPHEYLLAEFEKCKLPDLESALTLLKYEHVAVLFTFLEDCLDKEWNIILVARVLIFLVQLYQKQLSNFKNMATTLDRLSDKLQKNLSIHRDIVGMNLAVLSVKQK